MQSPPKSKDQEPRYLALLEWLANKINKEEIHKFCPRIFSWLSRTVLKTSEKGFDLVCSWFTEPSLIEMELESLMKEGKEANLLSEFFDDSRSEVIWKIKKMTSEFTW